MRLIIYTGKGGVGKTSTSAATAFRLAELGYRTILMSTDSAHSLGDSLDMKLGNSITHVRENLDVLEIDIIYEMRNKWSDIQNYVSAFMLSQGMGEISAEEMAILPGMEMISALFYVNQFDEQGTYDVVVMDTAPTGETLRLMSFPDVTNWYLDRGFPVIRRLMKIAKATVGKIMDMPLPSDEVMESIEDIKDNMSRVKVILEDPSRTTVRLVVNPEKMVIRETMRAYTYLSLYNKNVEALIVNRILPPEASESEFLRERFAEQEENMALIHSAFDPMVIKECPMMRTELRGEEKLREGMYVTIDIVTEEQTDVITVPVSAITETLDGNIVYVVEDGRASSRTVAVGSRNESEAVIVSGLEAGDVVITAGTVAEGSSVNVLE